MKKYVVLQSLKTNNKFYTTNTKSTDEGSTVSTSYRVLGYADTAEEAHGILYPTEEERMKVLVKHFMDSPFCYTEEKALSFISMYNL